MQIPSNGRAHIVGAGNNNLLRSVAAPWVEFQLLTGHPQLVKPDATINRPRSDNSLNMKDFEPQTGGELMTLYANRYKKSFMVFRWVACAVLHACGIRETRPSPSYRKPALIAIADTIKNHFVTIRPNVDSGLRNPLRLLVETVYENSRACRDDEAALLFFMLAEAVGIPSKFVLVEDGSGVWKAYVECQLDLASDWMAFDFNAGQWGRPIPGTKMYFSADGSATPTNSRALDFVDDKVTGKFVIPEELIGSSDYSKSKFWNKPKITPSWYPAIDRAIKSLPKNINSGFLMNKYYDHPNTDVAENFGPDVTGAIIAKAANIYSTKYRNVFRAIVEDAADAFRVDVSTLMPRELAQMNADLVRSIFPYAEETVGVEEITIPLRMFWFHCYYPGVLKFDCDDLTLCWMTLAESSGLATSIRLAGDAGQGDYYSGDKYHVYPTLIEDWSSLDHRFVFDVSAPTPWGVEMNRGQNFRDYEPRNPESFEPVLKKVAKKGFKVAASRLPGLLAGVAPPPLTTRGAFLNTRKVW